MCRLLIAYLVIWIWIPYVIFYATAMYYSEKDPLHKVSYKSRSVRTPRTIDQRRFQKALLRFHDEKNWPMLREQFRKMGRADLIGDGPKALIPDDQPKFKRVAANNQAKLRNKVNAAARGARGKGRRR